MWLLETQTEWVRAYGAPSPFLHAPDQVFYLFPLFYAGALFGLLSYPSLLFGAWPVFVATTVGAFVLMQQSVAWIARSLRVDRTLSAVLGLGFVTTPYVIALLYGRGAWTELVASAAVLLAIAGAAEVCSGGVMRRRAVVAMTVGAAVVAATHNLALLFGIPLCVLTLLAAMWATETAITRRALATVAASFATGTCLAGATLVPNLWLARLTWISRPAQTAHVLAKLHDFHDLGIVLHPWPVLPTSEPAGSAVYVQTAVPMLLWFVALTFVHRTKGVGRAAPLAALAVALLAAIVNPVWWRHLPMPLQTIQFPFRLVTWLSFAIITACAVTVSRAGPASLARKALIGVVFVQVGAAAAISTTADARAAIGQRPLRRTDITAGAVPSSFLGVQRLQFRFPGSVPRPAAERLAPQRLLDPPTSFSLYGTEGAGTRLATNIADSPLIGYMGDVRLVGRDKGGFAVLEVRPHSGPRWEATVQPRAPAVVWSGGLLTVASSLVAFIWWWNGLRGRIDRLRPPHLIPFKDRYVTSTDTSYSRSFIDETIEILRQASIEDVDRVVDVLVATRSSGGRLFLCGSGGGAGHASHAACDFRKMAGIESYCVTDNVSELTARINDEGWDGSYAAWLQVSRIAKNDCLFVFSVGGGDSDRNISVNLVRAMELAKEAGASVVGIVGRDGGMLRKLADASILVPCLEPANVTAQTEGLQALFWHAVVTNPRLCANTPKWESLTH